MSQKAHNRIKYFLYAMTILLAYLLEDAAFSPLNILWTPLIMPIAVTVIGLCEDQEKGGIYGLAAGMLWAVSTDFNMYGAWRILALSIIGVAAGMLSQRFLLKGLKTAILLSIPALALSDGMYVIFRSIGGTLPGLSFFTLFLPQCLISLVFCLLFYPMAGYISRIGGFHG